LWSLERQHSRGFAYAKRTGTVDRVLHSSGGKPASIFHRGGEVAAPAPPAAPCLIAHYSCGAIASLRSRRFAEAPDCAIQGAAARFPIRRHSKLASELPGWTDFPDVAVRYNLTYECPCRSSDAAQRALCARRVAFTKWRNPVGVVELVRSAFRLESRHRASPMHDEVWSC
jgi:hypothetical protein